MGWSSSSEQVGDGARGSSARARSRPSRSTGGSHGAYTRKTLALESLGLAAAPGRVVGEHGFPHQSRVQRRSPNKVRGSLSLSSAAESEAPPPTGQSAHSAR
eukprot:scaffold64583_cov48-Phaeocystis_antarctica.AAC.2